MNALKLRVCPDCPAYHADLAGLAMRASGCAMRCLPVRARQPLPAQWGDEYGLALIRRGILVRQRVDSAGRASAIDIAGPGTTITIAALTDNGATGYAVDDLLLCVLPRITFESAIEDCGVARGIVNAQASMLERVERIAEARSYTSAFTKVASLLLAIADTLCPPRRLTYVPSSIQQRDLAALLAMRHESVCRSVTALEKSGLVSRTTQGLHFADRTALEAV
ncbi:MAG: Crp/Fnr family transcriptional regulator [Polyangiaceae bacterium]|nr:Crp/Fnr family transcriptional regulator [Polyangiaceae bacterium]